MLTAVDSSSLQRLLEEKGLSKFVPLLNSLSRECIYLELAASRDGEIGTGSTMVGGYPDLPRHWEWPFSDNGVPLSFLAQIDLGALQVVQSPFEIPPGGFLYFFYDTENQPPGFHPANQSGHRVYYFEGDSSALSRRYKPGSLIEDRTSIFESSSVKFSCGLSLPVDYSLIADPELSRIYVEEIATSAGEINKMFGYPDVFQGSPELECELASNGIYCGDDAAFRRPDFENFRDRSQEWVLLLQLDSNEANDMQWGEGGRLFFFIRKQDLSRREFGRTWAILQA